MWAFCIYDPQKNILFLSRDRVGKKPLYYYFYNKKFIFSSELKTILKHNINPKLNNNAIDLYFSLGFIPAPYSIYKNIQKLEQDARPINDDDWGSERQIDAEIAFFEKVQSVVSTESFEKLEDYCLKATTDEMIDEALKIAS